MKAMKTNITVEQVIHAPIEHVWDCWTIPAHIVNWTFASDDWESPDAENDVRVGGSFSTRMQAKDGSEGFDFTGTYTHVKHLMLLEYDMADGRHVITQFAKHPNGTKIIETFEMEKENSPAMQKNGWQAILNNFKKYAEKTSKK